MAAKKKKNKKKKMVKRVILGILAVIFIAGGIYAGQAQYRGYRQCGGSVAHPSCGAFP